MIKLLAFSGSTRRDSFNKKILKIAVSAAETKGAEITLLDLKDYPLAFYDGDLEQEKGLPENAIKLKEIIKKQDGFLIASPEYNSAFSGILKNTIIGSKGEMGKIFKSSFQKQGLRVIEIEQKTPFPKWESLLADSQMHRKNTFGSAKNSTLLKA